MISGVQCHVIRMNDKHLLDTAGVVAIQIV